MQQNFWPEFAPGSGGGLDTAKEPSVFLYQGTALAGRLRMKQRRIQNTSFVKL
jgi:hypothetical protein